MSAVEQFITRHKIARYAFVLATFPIVAISDRVKGIWNPVGLQALSNALNWARIGGDPTIAVERPAPAPLSPKWQQRGDQGDAGSGSNPSGGAS